MRTFLAICFCFVSLALANAEWKRVEEVSLASPPGLEFRRYKATQEGEKVELHDVRFSPAKQTLAVMDNPDGDFTLASASRKRGALAAVNGGYFRPDRTPLGLVVRQGKTVHPLERAKLLSGLLTVNKGRIALLRVAQFKPSASTTEALQAGPFLIDGGKPVTGLNATRVAARTVIYMDASGRCGLLLCRHVTLAEMAEILMAPELVGGAKITRALNLDGGSSSGMWVGSEPEFYLREGKDVRNYIGIFPRAGE